MIKFVEDIEKRMEKIEKRGKDIGTQFIDQTSPFSNRIQKAPSNTDTPIPTLPTFNESDPFQNVKRYHDLMAHADLADSSFYRLFDSTSDEVSTWFQNLKPKSIDSFE